MNQSYTNKQAMVKLDITSHSAFYYFKRKYPHAFVVVDQRTTSGDGTRYDKQALDKFLELLKSLKG
jgi:ABC-type Zn uptake system ZnuABC Zn-binding protein ZnuA